MKIIIPLAGIGSRLKPHTNTVPKPLMEVAGIPIVEYVILESIKLNPSEIIFVVGYKKKSIKDYVSKFHPKLNCSYVEQTKRDGDGSAVRLALEKIKKEEDIFIIYGADTLIDFDIRKGIKNNKDADALIFTKKVDNPSNYGVVDIDSTREIYEVEEKPIIPKSNLAIIGAYYFKSLLHVKKQLNSFYEKGITEKGEYRTVQVINSYIKTKDKSIKSVCVEEWFDCGRPEVLLNANRYFLKKKSSNKQIIRGTSLILPPSYIAKSAKIENCIIGPYASIGSEVVIKNSIVKDSVVSYQSEIKNTILKESLIGKQVLIEGKKSKLNLGEKSHFAIL